MEHIKPKKKKWTFQPQEETIQFCTAISLICKRVNIAKISQVLTTQKKRKIIK